jgi:hypothetical protein
MKIEAFKKLIKESVREVLKEEGLLNENKSKSEFSKINPSKYMMVEEFKTTPYNKGFQPTSTGNPLQDLLKQTAIESNDLSNFA